MIWRRSWRADPAAKTLADRHYNRQNPDAAQFVPPGACVVLTAGEPVDALWVTSAPQAAYVRHQWAGAWVCSVYRNERPGRRSSDLIRQAIAATRHVMGEPPEIGMVTFVDETQVRPKAQPGRCFIEAGFIVAGRTTERGYLALLMPPDRMPAPARPHACLRDVDPAQMRLPA